MFVGEKWEKDLATKQDSWSFIMHAISSKNFEHRRLKRAADAGLLVMPIKENGLQAVKTPPHLQALHTGRLATFRTALGAL